MSSPAPTAVRNTQSVFHERRAECLLYAVIAALCVFLWQWAAVHYHFAGNWTALFCHGDAIRIPPELEPGTHVFKNSNGYDGQFYRLMAHDPFLTKGYYRYIDDSRLRCQRILVPALAWTLGIGRPDLIDGAYVLVILLTVMAGVYWSSRLMVLSGRHPAWGLVFLLVPATLTSLDRMLLDATLTAFFLGFILYTRNEEWGNAFVLAALAALTRETGIFLVIAGVGGLALRRRWGRAAVFGAAGLPALLWHLYVAARTPPSNASAVFARPVYGLLQRLFTQVPYPGEGELVLKAIHTLDFLSVLGLIGTLVFAGWWIWRSVRQTRLPGADVIAVALFLAVGLALGDPSHLFEAYGSARPISPLAALAMLEAARLSTPLLAVPPMLMSARIGLMFVSPLLSIVGGLTGLDLHLP